MTEKDSLGHLLFLVSREHHNLASRVFNQIGLYRGQPPVLFELGKHEGVTQSELAKRIEVTQATLTNLLRRMELAGLVTRLSDQVDARITRIYLTEFGREKLTQAQMMREVMERTAFADFSTEEQQLLFEYFTKIRLNLTGE